MTTEEEIHFLKQRVARLEALMIRAAAILARQQGVSQEEIDQIIIEGTRDTMKGKGEL